MTFPIEKSFLVLVVNSRAKQESFGFSSSWEPNSTMAEFSVDTRIDPPCIFFQYSTVVSTDGTHSIT